MKERTSSSHWADFVKVRVKVDHAEEGTTQLTPRWRRWRDFLRLANIRSMTNKPLVTWSEPAIWYFLAPFRVMQKRTPERSSSVFVVQCEPLYTCSAFPGRWTDTVAPWIGLCRSFSLNLSNFALWMQIPQWLGNFLSNSLLPRAKERAHTRTHVSLTFPVSGSLNLSLPFTKKKKKSVLPPPPPPSPRPPPPPCTHTQLIKQSTRFD